LVIAETAFGRLIQGMTSYQLKTRFRVGIALLAGGIALAGAGSATAQTGYSAAIYQEDSGTALSRHLRTLAESPRNLGALTGAAKAALELGDAQAAATFYARAEEIAPRDGRIKAGLGSAFIAMEQPQAALKFFEDARSLGAPEGEYAADRGLAYDLLGNPAQAQRDYATAMRTNDNDELRRRMALSKAISGDRAGALAAIDGQLRRQDRAAWRVRAFVLALTGDANGATEAVRAVMPAQAAAMQPFLTRLPALRPADRAMAVHFGHFPGDGSPVQMANVAPQQYAGVSPAVPQAISPPAYSTVPAYSTPPRATSTAPARRTATPTPAPSATTRRPGYGVSGSDYADERDFLRGSGPTRRRGVSRSAQPEQPTRVARTDVRVPAPGRSSAAQSNDPLARASVSNRPTQNPASSGSSQSAMQRPVVTTPPSTSQVATAPVQRQPVSTPAPSPTQYAGVPATRPFAPVQGPPVGSTPPVAVSPVIQQPAPANLLPNVATAAPSQANPTVPAAGASIGLAPSSAQALPVQPQTPATTIASVTPSASSVSAEASAVTAPAATGLSSGLADIAATIRALPSTGEETKSESKPAVKLAEATPKPAAKPAATAKKEVATGASSPSRYWVQLASAPDALAASEYKRLKAKAPKLLADTEAWKAPFRSTNRVLVGPFPDQKGAQSLVNALAKANIDAVPWTSAEGQEIVKLAAK
jgi:tetratricopeptide (TPR) repeat protein